MAAETAAKAALVHGLKSVDVMVKGPGSGREAAIRALQACGIDVTSIRDVTPVAVHQNAEESSTIIIHYVNGLYVSELYRRKTKTWQ